MKPELELIKIAKSLLAYFDIQKEMDNYVEGVYSDFEAEILPLSDRIFKQTTRKTFGKTIAQEKKFKDFAKKYSLKLDELYNLIRDYYFVKRSKDNLKQTVSNKFTKIFKDKKYKEMRPTSDVLPKEFYDFLPKNIAFIKENSGDYKNFVELFGNKRDTLEEKVKIVSGIAKKWNEMVKVVEKDYKSSDEYMRTKALMTMIAMQTGLRPASGEGATYVPDPDNKGKKILMETFGIRTMKKEHLNFIRDGVFELRFQGKKDSLNVSTLEDKKLYDALMDLIKRKGDKPLFVTKKGKLLSWDILDDYVKQFGYNLKDFRTYQANIEYYKILKEQLTEMYTQFDLVKAKEGKRMVKEVVAIVMEKLKQAAEAAQKRLNHKGDYTTTVHSYISPQITLFFLNQGYLPEDMTEVLDDNKKMEIRFRPENFFKYALSKVASVTDVFEITVLETGEESPRDIMKSVRDLLI